MNLPGGQPSFYKQQLMEAVVWHFVNRHPGTAILYKNVPREPPFCKTKRSGGAYKMHHPNPWGLITRGMMKLVWVLL